MHTLILNDPVYGFIRVPRGLLCRVIAHPLFQRLERIRQLGMAPFVYPAAHHTRKQHSIGALHLMQVALRTLGEKGYFIFDSEIEAAEAAILLHDIGHGPFSHVLEKELVSGITHEHISHLMMEQINRELHGELTLAISIFDGSYAKPFLHELISSQLDVDRLDYLCRDSFFTGVREGNIGAARIVTTLDLHDDHLVVDEKGLYSVENYLMARRLMYWQVYLHKTVLAAEAMFRSILRRARYLVQNGETLFGSPALLYFLKNDITAAHFADPDGEAFRRYAALDDSDLTCAVKVWGDSHDRILSMLARGFTDRRIFKVETCRADDRDQLLSETQQRLQAELGISADEASYFVGTKSVSNELYSTTAAGIGILAADGTVKDVAETSYVIRNDVPNKEAAKTYIFRYQIDN